MNTPPTNAAQVGIQYVRGKYTYPETALSDFQRFHEDRINTVMISMPWSHWENQPGTIDPVFLGNMAPVFLYAEQNSMSVVIASHINVNDGTDGNWQIPTWIQNMDEYIAPSSYLTVPEVRTEHVAYINRLIDATKNYPAVVGYVISKEAVSSTQWYVTNPTGRAIFDARWVGLIDNVQRVRQHMDVTDVTQYLAIGGNDQDPNYAAYTWANNGTVNLAEFWTETCDVIGNQGAAGLQRAGQWYPDTPKVRTEGRLYGAGMYDYDLAYDYEGLQNAAVSNMLAFYPWHVGEFSNPWNLTLQILDDRNDARGTPYYWALRDLASGVDSFETIDQADLPATDWTSQLAFDPTTASPGISSRWMGTGDIVGQKDRLPVQAPQSTIAATITLDIGEYVKRSVVAAHWVDSGVTAGDAFTFLARTDGDYDVILVAEMTGHSPVGSMIHVSGTEWRRYEVSFSELELTETEISQITTVGLYNFSSEAMNFDIDEFLIRQASLVMGDANGDGMVNLADLQILGDHWQLTTASWTEGDFTGDGNVNLADLQIIGDNWGYGTNVDMKLEDGLAATGMTIPEPESIVLMLSALITFACRRHVCNILTDAYVVFYDGSKT
ncbi:MAG: hypothetical protein IT445_18820 [Phycisphaeraceae bacterium]|nr:hypothetical protein [Phycisphaeraceae bacterium]